MLFRSRAALADRLQSAIKARTNVQMQMVEVPVSALPVFTYKARRWTDERREGYFSGGKA